MESEGIKYVTIGGRRVPMSGGKWRGAVGTEAGRGEVGGGGEGTRYIGRGKEKAGKYRVLPIKVRVGFDKKVEAAELANGETEVAKAEEANGELVGAAGTESACAAETENVGGERKGEPIKKGRRGRKGKKAADVDGLL